MDAPIYNTKLILNWFESVSFRFGMGENLPGVGAGQSLMVNPRMLYVD